MKRSLIGLVVAFALAAFAFVTPASAAVQTGMVSEVVGLLQIDAAPADVAQVATEHQKGTNSAIPTYGGSTNPADGVLGSLYKTSTHLSSAERYAFAKFEVGWPAGVG